MKICVFCSSSGIIDDVYFNEAKALGTQITKNKFSLVYGGANVGLMGTLAEAVKYNQGHVHGIIPKRIQEKGLAYDGADILEITDSMHERKSRMEAASSAFIALPGGFGTIEELIEVITLKQLGYHNKPIVLINTNNFFAKLVDFFEHIYTTHFAKEEYRSLYHIANSSLEAIQYIKAYNPDSAITDKWFQVD